ncbi:MAG: YiiX/YebB-like N1pC/P60 family cysteine hydrolase [Phycisphaerales bacterium]|nr:YiiX/YebB-like N1pC/P60 family cysteine hydrolase [Phycisphaerales bacterium]
MRTSIFILCCILIACQHESATIQNKPSGATIADSLVSKITQGDLVLRAGKDEMSQLFCRLNARNKNYSHCGVVFKTDSGCYVYHIIGGVDNFEGKIVYEPMAHFVSNAKNTRWAIVHYDLDSLIRAAFCKRILQYAQQHITFDSQFDLATEHQMYCSEMVSKAFVFATHDTDYISKTIAHSGKPYIAIDNLFDNNHGRIICEVIYN